MLLEITKLTIRPGHEDAFADAMAQHGLPILLGVPGVISVRHGRGVENPEKFVLMVEWDTMAAHIAFSDLPVYPEFGKLVAPHMSSATMEHFEV